MQRELEARHKKPRQKLAIPAVIPAWTLFLVAITRGSGSIADDSREDYQNPDYGYAIRIPPGVGLEKSKPPNPNHGFGIRLGPESLLWVDASYTDDVSLHTVVTSERQSWEGNCRELTHRPAQLGGLAAERMTLKCASAQDRGVPAIVTLVVAVSSRPNRGTVKYEIGSRLPFGQPTTADALKVFRKLVEGFHLIPVRR